MSLHSSLIGGNTESTKDMNDENEIDDMIGAPVGPLPTVSSRYVTE